MDKQLCEAALQCHHNTRFGNIPVDTAKQIALGDFALAYLRGMASR